MGLVLPAATLEAPAYIAPCSAVPPGGRVAAPTRRSFNDDDRRRPPAVQGQAQAKQPRPRPEPITPERTTRLPAIYNRTMEGRQIDFLEVVAWAVCRLESCDREELARFGQELRVTREREWGLRPWSGAKDPERFLQHVAAMAEDFTTNPVRFRNRTRQPNPAA